MGRSLPRALGLALLAALAACGSPENKAAKQRVFSGSSEAASGQPFDWNRPEAALSVGADEAAARLGSFDWAATVTWSVAREGTRAHMAERHRVRQSAGGEFEVQVDLDPGEGPGSEAGRRIVYANKMTYARSRYAPSGSWRERPTDRGRDARRYRDESFGIPAELAALCGPGLRLQPAGEGSLLGRKARRFRFSLDRAAAPAGRTKLGSQPPAGGADPDTQVRLAFLDGRVPVRAEGELLADAEGGVPLEVRLRCDFQVKGDPAARAEVELSAQVRAVGGSVAAVVPPAQVLPDERKTRGVARALEAAGLRKKGSAAEERAEPAEEAE
jgi:hypothetical protein